MKQLELNVIIEKTENNKYELWAAPKDIDDSTLYSWCTGETYVKTINRFLEGMCDHNVKYWFILQDK